MVVIYSALANSYAAAYAATSTVNPLPVPAKRDSTTAKSTAASSPTTQPTAQLPPNKNFRPAEIGGVIFVLNDPSLLSHVLPPIAFHHKTLSDVLTTFSTLTNTNVAAGWSAMAHAGIKPNRRVSFHLPKQGYKLDMVAALKTFAPDVRMVISADQNVIFVNTQAADNQHLIMRTYWLDDLIANIPRYINPYSFERRKSPVGAGGKPSRREHSADKASAGQNKQSRTQTNILQLITDHVEPKIWLDHGGKATISQVGNKVIVIAPASVQALLQGPSHHNPNAAPLFMTVSY